MKQVAICGASNKFLTVAFANKRETTSTLEVVVTNGINALVSLIL